MVPVRLMNAPLIIRESGSEDSRAPNAPNVGRRTKSMASRSPQKRVETVSAMEDSSSDSDGSRSADTHSLGGGMTDVQLGVEEMVLGDRDAPSSSNVRVSRGYDLPRQRNPGDHPKIVCILENILRPDHIPRWLCPEIRFHFNEFYESFDTTTLEYRAEMWEAFKKWYIVPAEINEAVRKLFLEQLGSCYKNFVARLKRAALGRAKLTFASPELLKYPPAFLSNRLPLWKRWVDNWTDEKQLKISEINSRNRQSQNGGLGTHTRGSKSHSRMTSQVIDATRKHPSIAKRLRMQYGKKDNEGNSTDELLNPKSQALLEEERSYIRLWVN